MQLRHSSNHSSIRNQPGKRDVYPLPDCGHLGGVFRGPFCFFLASKRKEEILKTLAVSLLGNSPATSESKNHSGRKLFTKFADRIDLKKMIKNH